MYPFSFLKGGASIDEQALISYNSLIDAGFTVPKGLESINFAFKTIKTIYGTSDITTAISFFADPSLSYHMGAGAGTTAGQAIRTLPNIVDPTRLTDAVQTTAASQPLLLVHSGANYYFGSGVANNFVSTPNASANQITGDIDIKVFYEPQDIMQYSQLVRKIQSSDAYNFWQWGTGTGTLYFATQYDSVVSSNHGVASGTEIWFRVTRVAATGATVFYKSIDGVNWTTISSHTMASGNLLTAGDLTIGLSNPQVAKYYKVTISNSIGGAPVVDFNPNQYNAANSQTQWTSSTGEVWSVQTGTATSGYKGVLVTKTIIQGDGVDDRMITSSNIITADGFTMYTAFRGLKNDFGTGANTFGMNNDDGSISRTDAISIRFWFGALGVRNLVISGIDATRLGLAITRRKSGDFAVSFNNGTNNTSTEAVVYTPNLLTIFNYNTAVFTNSIFNTGIITKITDDSIQRTAMYQYIRSVNDLAF